MRVSRDYDYVTHCHCQMSESSPFRACVKAMLSVSALEGDVYASAQTRMEETLRDCGDSSFESTACCGRGPPLQRTFEKLDAVINQLPDDQRASSMWDVVHATALACERFTGSSDAHKAQFNRLATFVLRCYVPYSLRCRRCSKLWNAALKEASPIPAASLFAKTVELHNEVNAIIGKGSVGEVDARAIYAWAA
jgi:hypothetical protein